MEKLAIHRPACGRAEPLGALYDIHTDKFVPGNIFCDKSMADFVNTESINSLEYSQSFTDDLKDRREALNISGEVSLSILAGLIKVGGSASYINDSKNTEHSVQYHITQHIRTVTQSLNFYNSDMLKHIALNAVNCGATHVVWKIEKGADACMSVIYKYGKGSSLMDVKGELQGKLDKWKVSLDAKIRGDYVDGEDFTTRNLEVKVHADVAPPVLRLPDTLESAMEMLKSIYESIMTNGEGVAQQYFLVDLRALAMLWQVEIAVQKMYTEISVKVIGNLEEMLRKIESQKRRIKEIKEKSNNPAVSEDGIRRIVEKYQMCDAEETEIKKELMTLLPRAREGDNNALVDLTLLPNKCVELSESSVSCFMVENKSTIRAINLYNDLSEKNVKFVYTPEELQRLRRANQDPAQKIYILFFSVNIESQDEATWSETLDIFLAIEGSSSNILVAVNKDNNPEILEAEQIGQVNKLAIWSAGVYRTKDLHAMMKKMKTTNMAYPQSPAKEKTLGFCEIVYAKVRCPNDGCNLEEVQKLMWTCYECNEILEFDLKESFYCDCGSRLAKQFEFKCCRESHGTTRNTFCDEMLQDLQQLKKCEQINILIIGETGVGKTTFINSTACYTKYGSLTEAEQNDLMWLIPFKIEDGQRVVKVGDPGNNEQFDGVGSATQHPLEHYFKVDDYIYCLIDTPGIGDTRGIRQDKINMQNIMHSLKKFDKLHQICFLMDPDKCRLTETFEFCFKELIMQFHRSALRNLVFCFTRGSGVCYQPGATLTPLRALMDEIAEKFDLQYELKQGDTVFVVDNFAYRYLALTLEGKLSIPDRPIYENSYEVSSKVIKQMMARATSKSIPPHLVKDSQHVNQARSVIVAITDPLTLIGTAVRNTLSQQEQFQRDLISCTLTRAELEEKVEIRLKTFHYTMEMENKWSCKLCNKKVYYRGEQRHKFIEADPSLANEDPIVVWEGPNAEENDGVPFCPQHGVKFPKVSSNRTFYTKVAEEVRRDPLIEQQLANATSSAEKQRILIQESKNLTNALQAEEKLINKAAAKFGLFLKNSTLVHYNDKTESHLLLCIHLEEERGGVRSQKWKDLQHMLKQYKEERDIITSRMMEAGDLPLQSIDPQDILALIEELKDLKYYGKDVVKALKLLENNAYPQDVQPTYYKDKSTPSKFRRALKWMGKLFKF